MLIMENWSTNEFSLEEFIIVAWLHRFKFYNKYRNNLELHAMAQFPTENYEN